MNENLIADINLEGISLTTSKQLISEEIIGTVKGYNVYLRQYAWETDLDPIKNESLISYNGFIYYDAPNSYYTFHTDNGVTSEVSGLISYKESLQGTITFVAKQEYLIIAKAVPVSHNSDGSKSGTLKLDANITNWFSGSTSETVNCQTIPRYATCSQSLNNREETTVKMNWSSDSTCDYLWYSKDNGSTWIAVDSVNGTSGTYIISGLSANTTYNIKTRLRRKDSQLTTDSSELKVTTYQYPYITNISNSSLIIGKQQKVSLYNPLKRNVTVYMKKDSKTGTTLYSQTTTESSLEFTPSASTLYSTIPNHTKANAVYYCTYSSQTIATKSGTYSIDVNQCKPTFSNFEYSTNLSELTNNSNTIIDSKTTTTFVISSANKAVAKNGASISKYRIECGSQSANIDYSNNDISGAIANCNSNILKVTAIDSRGLETTVSKTVSNYINYTKPIIMSSAASRKDGVEAETHLSLNINFFNGDFGNGANKITSLKYRVLTGTSWSEYFTIDLNNISYSNNTALLEDYLVHANGSSGGFEVGTSYGIQVMLSDGLDTYILETIYSDLITVTDGKVGISMFKDSDNNYHVGINGMPDNEHFLKTNGSIFVGSIESKNIFDSHMESGDLHAGNGKNENNSGKMRSVTYLKVKPNTTYSITSNSPTARIVEYTSAKAFIKCHFNTSTITTSSTTEYIRFSFTSATYPLNVQVEKGPATEYYPHINFNNQQIYSYEEQLIGKWIDGKNLYRRMVYCGNLPANNKINVAHGISNVQHIHVNLGETMWTGNNLSFTEKTTNYSPLYEDASFYVNKLGANDTSIILGTATSDSQYFHILVCVEYTKTTD